MIAIVFERKRYRRLMQLSEVLIGCRCWRGGTL